MADNCGKLLGAGTKEGAKREKGRGRPLGLSHIPIGIHAIAGDPRWASDQADRPTSWDACLALSSAV